MDKLCPPVSATAAAPGNIPSDLKLTVSPAPVIEWGGYVYYLFSFIDNRVSYCVVAYDTNHQIAFRKEVTGNRYINGVSVDKTNYHLVINGQYGTTHVSWADVFVPPTILTVNSSAVPVTIPPGLKVPSWPTFPIVSWGGFTFYPFSYIDNRVVTLVVAYDHTGTAVASFPGNSARYISSISIDQSQRILTFTGQSNQSFSIPYTSIGLSYLLCYMATPEDIMFIATLYQIPFSQTEAQQLAAVLPMFSCCNCMPTATNMLAMMHVKEFKLPESFWTGAAGAIIGGIIGAAAGFVIGGGPLGAIAGFTIGSAIGANVGNHITLNQPTYTYNPTVLEQNNTFVYQPDFALGPFPNSGVWQNMIDISFPRYSAIPEAGAVAKPAAGNIMQVFYPTSNSITLPNLTKYTPINNIFKMIFVIIKVPGYGSGNDHAFQMRIHPEDFFPDTINSKDRVNHSQLSEGNRILAIMGYTDMQVWGAGSLYVQNNKIWGMDTRTGHYYFSFNRQDATILAQSKSLLVRLGYDTSAMVDWPKQQDLLGSFY